MQNEDAQDARNHTTTGPMDGVQRLELLSRRFSSAEIDHLSRLQLRHWERPEALDMPVEESRWLFARWLLEHAKIGDGVLSQESRARVANHTRRPIEQTTTWRRNHVLLPRNATSPGWALRLLRQLARICRDIAGSAGRRDKVGDMPSLPSEYASWYHGPWDFYGSTRALTTAQLLQLGYWHIR